MATGTFKLVYKEGSTWHPCVDVEYAVENSQKVTVASGKTDENGRTKTFNGLLNDDTLTLRVKSATGGWDAPEVHKDSEGSASMDLASMHGKGSQTQTIRVQPFYQVKFITHGDGKGVAGATFVATTLDSRGKEATAVDDTTGRPIKGTTNAQGETPVFHCGQRLVWKFTVAGTSVSVVSKRLEPLVKGQVYAKYSLPLKTARAMTALDDNHQADLSGKNSAPALISPADEELIMVKQRDFDEFEEMSGRLDKIIAAMHTAKLDLSRALEAQNAADIQAAEKALGLAEDEVKKELNSNFSKLADLKEVITLESYKKGVNSETGAAQIGLRRRYLKTDKYMELRNKRINKTEYKIAVKFSGPGGTKTSSSDSPKTLDAPALKASFKKIADAVKTKKEWQGDPAVLDVISLAGNQYADNLLKSATYDVSAQAQWLRLVSSSGASAEVDWAKRKAQIQGSLQDKAVLCEGKIKVTYAAPSLKGWMMSCAGEDLGALRFVLEMEVYGFAGAKTVATGAVGVSLEGTKQVVKAIRRDGKDSFTKLIDPKTKLPKFDPVAPYEKTPENLNGVKADLDAFAGVEVGLTPGGKIQWLPPQEKDFVSFAEVSATVAVSAGAGLQAQLAIYFDDGKFRVRAAARLCWGLGCKGAVEFTVDPGKLLEFAGWVHYQLLHAGFKMLVYFAKDAFDIYSQLLLLLAVEGSPAEARIREISVTVNESFDQFLTSLDVAQERNAVVSNINRNPPWLVHATPETRGMLLYQITRHGMPSHMRDAPSVEGSVFDPQIHFLDTHKAAVNTIMKTVHTAAEWHNVMQHMTMRGTKSAKPVGTNEGDVLRFLNHGISLAELPSVFEALNEPGPVMKAVSDKKGTGNSYLDTYLGMRGKLLDKFPKGYKIASLDSSAFDTLAPVDGQRHMHFGEIQTAGLGEAFAGDPGSSLA